MNSLDDQSEGWLEVMIVDARPADYVELAASLSAREVSFRFARSANDALRMKRRSNRAVWLINVALPDMTGTELLALLREREQPLAGSLVGEWYRPDDEMEVRACGHAFYVCKPVVREWLEPWLPMQAPLKHQDPVPLSAVG